MANRLSLALLSMCSLNVAGAKKLYMHHHALLTPQESYPGDAVMCSLQTIDPNATNPSYELDKCYFQGVGTGAPTTSMYSLNDTGHVVTHTWFFDCTYGKPCHPKCEAGPPKSEWAQLSLGVNSCSTDKRFVHGKGVVTANWCDGDDRAAAFACVSSAFRTPVDKRRTTCPNADLSATTVKKLCGSHQGRTCGCFSAGTNDLM